MGGRSGMGGGRGGDGDRGGMRERMQPAEELEIEQSATDVVIRDKRSGETRLKTDGSRQSVAAFSDRDATVIAKWKGDKLVVTSEVEEGPSTKDVYARTTDGAQLIDTRTMSGRNGRFSMKLKLVYDRDATQ